MSASQVLLASHGPEDRWLTEAPNRTYFEGKYKTRVNRLHETFEVPFDNQEATFGGTGRCTIPVRGDYLTHLTLRTVFPPIYPTQQGQYVYPTPSSQISAGVYVNMGLTQVVADGTTLTANTTSSHYFSVGESVTLSGTSYRIFDLDGTYTIASIPTANSFTCSVTIAGISYTGTASVLGLIPSDVVGYFSTSNFDLWADNLTNKSWQITNAVFNGAGTELTVTTSTPSGFSVGQNVNITINSIIGSNRIYTIITATDTTFTINLSKLFVAVTTNNVMYSRDGEVWTYASQPSNGSWSTVTYGNGKFVAFAGSVYTNKVSYSYDGDVWYTSTVYGLYSSVIYENNIFIAVGYIAVFSTDGILWTPASNSYYGILWKSVTYGNGTFVAVGTDNAMYSTDGGKNWLIADPPPPSGTWISVTYGDNNRYVAVSSEGYIMQRSIDDSTWHLLISQPTGIWQCVTYGNGMYVCAELNGNFIYSQYGTSWSQISIPSTDINWNSVTYGNGKFVAIGYNTVTLDGCSVNSTNGVSWSYASDPQQGQWKSVTYTKPYLFNPADLVYIDVAPLIITSTPTQFVFSSSVYPSISFANSQDASFWGFDSRSGLVYSLPITAPWTYTQSGWGPGFLPPSLSTWDDSVSHKLCKAVRIMLGKQIIKEYSGEYIEIQNDLTVSYENKAILKLMNGTLDQTQSIAPREYYTTLPIGTKEIPLCALTNQQISVEVDFEKYTNLSSQLNPGTGNFLDPKSYLVYNASSGILNGQPINVQTTLSYQQYIFIITYGGNIIVYDTTTPVDVPESYVVITALAGSTGLFSQFCILGGMIYIQLVNGYMVSGIVSEFVLGNISSFLSNSYLPGPVDDIGPPTGTMVADARYIYYAQSNLAQSNVFMTRYDTRTPLDSFVGYTSFDFTSNIDSQVTMLYQIISTGIQLIALTDKSRTFYVYNLNSLFTTSWINVQTPLDTITNGVTIKKTVYFNVLVDGSNLTIMSYLDGMFTIYSLPFGAFLISGTSLYKLYAIGSIIYTSVNTYITNEPILIQIDTTGDLNSSSAYTYYSSTTPDAPQVFDGTAPKIFANGPRYIYMFTSDSSQTTTPTNIIRFDPYPSVQVLKSSVLVDYESLPDGTIKPDKALIGLIQTQKVTDMNNMDIHGPVKELWVTGASLSTNVFQYSNLATRSTLALAGERIVTDDDGTHTFLNVIEPFETHTSMPIRNVSVVSFEFDPESSLPNGTINFSRIRDQVFDGNAQTVWARNYNILAIQGGIGGLMFN